MPDIWKKTGIIDVKFFPFLHHIDGILVAKHAPVIFLSVVFVRVFGGEEAKQS